MKTTDGGRRTEEDGDPGRRDVVKLIAAASLAAVGIGAPEIARASELADAALRQQGAPPFVPVFFTAAEWPVVRSLVDQVIPSDARSGSATEAGVPEFMDFIMNDHPRSQSWMRDGLKWVDAECNKRFDRSWLKCSPAQQRLLLNDIAFPKKAPAALKAGVEFFTRFRDLTSSGFWTSRMGVKDLGYMGNITMGEWTGCPQPVLTKIGVSYKTSMHAKRG
jgi:hypothetical protein